MYKLVDRYLARERVIAIKKAANDGEDWKAHQLRDELLIDVIRNIADHAAPGSWVSELADTALAALEINFTINYE